MEGNGAEGKTCEGLVADIGVTVGWRGDATVGEGYSIFMSGESMSESESSIGGFV